MTKQQLVLKEGATRDRPIRVCVVGADGREITHTDMDLSAAAQFSKDLYHLAEDVARSRAH